MCAEGFPQDCHRAGELLEQVLDALGHLGPRSVRKRAAGIE
jgi:hypothetical protein